MKLSIVVPSNRTTINAYSKLVNLLSFATDDIEVLIRDNSGNEDKRRFLSQFNGGTRKIVLADPCGAWENGIAITEMAVGDYIFNGCDDDYINPFALPDIIDTIATHGDDKSLIGVTGNYLVEYPTHSAMFSFPTPESDVAYTRVESILQGMPSTIQFSAIRRDVYLRCLTTVKTMPLNFSFHDFLFNLMLLMSGRLAKINRMIYQYDMGNWIDPAIALREDAKYYAYSGVDPSGVRLHWLIGALEGAKLAAGKFTGADLPMDQRLAIAQRWFVQWFFWFQNMPPREAPGAKFDAQAQALADKWRVTPMDKIDFNELLTDLCGFFALTSPEAGQRYYDYWR